jgi:hypothetical protein
MIKVYEQVNAELDKRFAHGEKVDFLMPNPDLPYVVLDRRKFEKAGIDEKAAEDAVAALLPTAVGAQGSTPPPFLKGTQPALPEPSQKRLPPAPRVQYTFTRLQFADDKLPPTDLGRMLAHSYVDHGNWFVMMVLDAYQMSGEGQFGGTTHFSPWSYDRHVPLAFYGSAFVPGEYHELVAPVDLAVTFASLAGVNRPSAAVGRVLTEALKPTNPGSER